MLSKILKVILLLLLLLSPPPPPPPNPLSAHPLSTEDVLQREELTRFRFKIFVVNARSAFKKENVYFIEKFLTEEKPDFLLINESGEYKETIY